MWGFHLLENCANRYQKQSCLLPMLPIVLLNNCFFQRPLTGFQQTLYFSPISSWDGWDSSGKALIISKWNKEIVIIGYSFIEITYRHHVRLFSYQCHCGNLFFPLGLQSLNYLLSGSLQKKFADLLTYHYLFLPQTQNSKPCMMWLLPTSPVNSASFLLNTSSPSSLQDFYIYCILYLDHL